MQRSTPKQHTYKCNKGGVKQPKYEPAAQRASRKLLHRLQEAKPKVHKP
jgi:hypothetical protein